MQAEGEVVQLHEAAGRPRDFRTLYEDEHRRLFQTLYFVTGNRHDAADLMHEAFLKLWERWDSIGEIRDVHAYLFKVALNGSRLRARAARRAARRRISLGIVHDPFDEVELREDVRRIAEGHRIHRSACQAASSYSRMSPPNTWCARILGRRVGHGARSGLGSGVRRSRPR
jgi:DNA-directed RNA polymerase specialized sigma24 family protein